MKYLIVLALLAVVTALPPRHGFGDQQHEDYQVDGPSHHQNNHIKFNLIKLVYKYLIENLSHPPQDDNEEEERAINDIVDTINIIGQIIHDKSNDDDDDNYGYNRPPQSQRPEHKGPESHVPNEPSGSDNDGRPDGQDEEKKLPSIDRSEDEVISYANELPESDESQGDELSIVDSVLDIDGSEHNIFSVVNKKDDEENPFVAYKLKSVANEVPDL